MHNVPTLRAVYTKSRVTKSYLVTQSPFSHYQWHPLPNSILWQAVHILHSSLSRSQSAKDIPLLIHVSMATQPNLHMESAQEEVWQSCRDRPQDKWKTTRLDILCSTVAPSVPKPAQGSRTGKDLSAVGATRRNWAGLPAPVQADTTHLLLQSMTLRGTQSKEEHAGITLYSGPPS